MISQIKNITEKKKTGPYFKGKWQYMDRNEKNISKFLSLGEKICLYDLGSSGGTPPPFSWILEGIDIINFEPDARAESNRYGETLPVAIGPKALDTIFLNRRQTTSSLLKPYLKILNRYDFSRIFKNEGDIFCTIDTKKVKTYGLDEIIKIKNLPLPDFLKIDVQGLSFEVLESAQACLSSSVLGIKIEVEFLKTYQDQKTFGEIHEFLYKRGFEIFRLDNLQKWFYNTKKTLKLYTGQDIFCDLLYIRNIESLDDEPEFWNKEKCIGIILICLLYDLTDTASVFLDKMYSKKMISLTIYNQLDELITKWEGAMKFFHKINIVKYFYYNFIQSIQQKLTKLVK